MGLFLLDLPRGMGNLPRENLLLFPFSLVLPRALAGVEPLTPNPEVTVGAKTLPPWTILPYCNAQAAFPIKLVRGRDKQGTPDGHPPGESPGESLPEALPIRNSEFGVRIRLGFYPLARVVTLGLFCLFEGTGAPVSPPSPLQRRHSRSR